MLRSLHDKIPILLLEKIVSRSGNSSHLLAVRLSSPQEETIKLPNPVGHSKPPIVFTYSKERHLSLEPSKEFKNDYLTRAITLGTTLLSLEESIDFLIHIRSSTFVVFTVYNNKTHDNLTQDSSS